MAAPPDQMELDFSAPLARREQPASSSSPTGTTRDPPPAVEPQPAALGEPLGVRMINEYVYCPRLFYYETVEGLFAHNADTLEGAEAHRRVDAARPGKLDSKSSKTESENEPRETDEPETIHARSVSLYSPTLHVTAKLDLVEGAREGAAESMLYTPVEYKKGRPREGEDARELWDADRVQLTLQILLLRENGFPSEEGIVYYRETHQRVTFRPTDDDEAWARRMVEEARECQRGAIPAPLDHSPKCPRCSLASICLPDETRLLADETPAALHPNNQPELPLPLPSAVAAHYPRPHIALIDYINRVPIPGIRRVKPDPEMRRLIAPNPDTRTLYLNTAGTWVGRKGGTLTVKEDGNLIGEFRLKDLHHVALFGPVQISTAAVQTLCEEEIPLTYFSTGGWFYGLTRGHTLKNVFTRIEQFRLAADPTGALAIARQFIYGKIVNQRTLLMRNHVEPPREVLRALKYFANAALTATHLNHLLGVEGNAAAFYFGAFGGMLKPRTQPANGGENLDDTKQPMTEPREATFPFYPDARNRRPPRDHVTADLLAACDGWIQRFLSKASSNAPSSIARAARRLEAAIFARCAAPQSDHPPSTQELLASLGDCERALANSAKWSAENYIPPIPPLSPKWITAAATDDTEFRLAASLASLGLWIDKQFFPIRRHLEAVKIGFGNPPWAAWDEDSSTEVVSSDGSATSLLIGIIRRRLLLAQKLGGTRWPEYARVTAWPSDIIDFIEGRIDDSRFIRLLWGLCLTGFPPDD